MINLLKNLWTLFFIDHRSQL